MALAALVLEAMIVRGGLRFGLVVRLARFRAQWKNSLENHFTVPRARPHTNHYVYECSGKRDLEVDPPRWRGVVVCAEAVNIA